MKNENSNFANKRKVILRLKLFISKFLKEYRRITEMKRTHVTKDVKAIKETVTIIILTGFVAVVIGLVTNTISNLSYVINILNTIILGSFIMHKVIREKRIKFKCNLEYNIVYSILLDILEFSTLVVGTSLMIQLMYLYSFSSVLTLITYAAMLLLLIVVYYSMHYRTVYRQNPFPGTIKLLFLSLFLSLLFGLISHLVPIKNMMVNFSITYTIMSGIYLYVSNVKVKYEIINKNTYAVIGVVILIVIYSFVGSTNHGKEYVREQFFHSASYTFNYDNKIPVDEYGDVVVNDNYIIMTYSDYTEFYNHDFELVHSLPMNNENLYATNQFYDFNNEIFYIERVDRDSDTTLYKLNDTFESEFVLSTSDGYGFLYPFDDNYIVVPRSLSNGISSTITSKDIYGYYEVELIYGFRYSNDQLARNIIEMNDKYILFYNHDGALSYADSHYSSDFNLQYYFYYDEGKVLYKENNSDNNTKGYICDPEDFLFNNMEDCILLDRTDKIIGFEVTDNLYIVTYEDKVFLNEDSYYDDYLTKDGEFLYSTVLLSRVEQYQISRDEDFIYFADIESKPVLIVEDYFPIGIDIMFVLSAAVTSYLILPSLVLKGGKYHG